MRQTDLVLVVEDDPDIRDTMRDVLQSEGLEVVTAANGREALERLASPRRPCIILLDLMMPVMNGLELLEALHHDPNLATIPVFLVSAYEHLARQAKGAAGFMKKPIDLDVLVDTIQRVCC
jgi:CheY-like chemotaxis protein